MPKPGKQPETPAPAAGGNSSEAKPPLPTQFYSPSQAVPEEAIRSGQQIYEAGEINGLLTTMANGGQAPTQFRRSARAAGMTPGEFLLRQAALAGFEIPPQMEKKILRQSNQSMGMQQSLVAMSPGRGPLSQSTGVLLNILTGSAPSYTRTFVG